MAKKKLTLQYNYKKDTKITNKQEVLDIIAGTDEIYIVQETFYDDGTESFKIEVHHKPKNDVRP